MCRIGACSYWFCLWPHPPPVAVFSPSEAGTVPPLIIVSIAFFKSLMAAFLGLFFKRWMLSIHSCATSLLCCCSVSVGNWQCCGKKIIWFRGAVRPCFWNVKSHVSIMIECWSAIPTVDASGSHDSLPAGASYTTALVLGGAIGCLFQSYHFL